MTAVRDRRQSPAHRAARSRVHPRPQPPRPAVEPPADDPALAAAEAYWEETRRPFACLLFLAPLLIAYEVGVLWLGADGAAPVRNGADAWMRSWLYSAGVHQSFVLPLVVMGLLFAWNFYGYFTWRVRPETLAGMFAESVVFAFALVVAGQLSELACRQAGLPTVAIQADGASRGREPAGVAANAPGEIERIPIGDAPLGNAGGAAGDPLTSGPSPEGEGDREAKRQEVRDSTDGLTPSARGVSPSSLHPVLPSPARETIARAVTYVGAGVYEEVLFRLLLLPACYGWFRLLRAGPRASATLAVLTTSLLFALAHYVGPAGDSLVPYTFCFRAAAGAYFAALFVTRGFGITVGTHAVYDLIVGVLWAT